MTLQLTSGTLVASPTSLAFTQTLGGAAPANQTLNITSNGQPLNFAVAASNPGTVQWLSVSGNTTGQTPGSVADRRRWLQTLSRQLPGHGDYHAPSASNVLTVNVTLTVASGSDFRHSDCADLHADL